MYSHYLEKEMLTLQPTCIILRFFGLGGSNFNRVENHDENGNRLIALFIKKLVITKFKNWFFKSREGRRV